MELNSLGETKMLRGKFVPKAICPP